MTSSFCDQDALAKAEADAAAMSAVHKKPGPISAGPVSAPAPPKSAAEGKAAAAGNSCACVCVVYLVCGWLTVSVVANQRATVMRMREAFAREVQDEVNRRQPQPPEPELVAPPDDDWRKYPPPRTRYVLVCSRQICTWFPN